MSYTLDANLLLYASDAESAFHEPALAFVKRIGTGPEIVYLFWPTVMAYLRVATHPAVFERPLPARIAMANVGALIELPHVQCPGEGRRFWGLFYRVAEDAAARGNLVPDAHLVALMIEHGVRTIWTHDRDFRKFPNVEVRDPFA